MWAANNTSGSAGGLGTLTINGAATFRARARTFAANSSGGASSTGTWSKPVALGMWGAGMTVGAGGRSREWEITL